MVSQVSGSSRSRRIAGICRGKATIERSNGKRGLIAFNFSGLREGREVEGEKKTNAHHV